MENTTSKLGQYLLQGWTMTDQVCPNGNCPGVPLMAKDGVKFCANCDQNPALDKSKNLENINNSTNSAASAGSGSSTTATATAAAQDESHSSSAGSQLEILSVPSRSSTPPTPESVAHPPQHQQDEVIPHIDNEILARRRQQSDRASEEIGRLLLQGWALLGEECPNQECLGIPLMRPPSKTPQQKKDQQDNNKSNSNSETKKIPDPRKYCVICEQYFVNERDVQAMNQQQQQERQEQEAEQQQDAPRKPSKRRFQESSLQERNSRKGQTQPQQQQQQQQQGSTSLPPLPEKSSIGNNRNLASSQHATPDPSLSSPESKFTKSLPKRPVSMQTNTNNREHAIQMMDLSVQRLTDELNHYTQSNPLDVNAVAVTAEAIARVSKAMSTIQETL